MKLSRTVAYTDSSGELTVLMSHRLEVGRSILKHTKKKHVLKMIDKKNTCRGCHQMTLYKCDEWKDISKGTWKPAHTLRT